MLMRYADGAALSDDELTRRAKGKAVLIGAMEDDQIPLPDGSEAAGVFVHAAALADMLKDRGVQELSSLGVMAWCAFASVAGCVVCIFAPRLWQLVVGLIILGGMSAIAAGVLPRASLWAELPVGLTMLAVAACVGLGVRMVVSRKVA
jgi:CHASE2 domain-containing sensor protein